MDCPLYLFRSLQGGEKVARLAQFSCAIGIKVNLIHLKECVNEVGRFHGLTTFPLQLSEAVSEHLDFKGVVVRVEDFLSLTEDFGLHPLLLLQDVKDADREHLGVVALYDERNAGGIDARGEGVNNLETLFIEFLLQFASGRYDVSDSFPLLMCKLSYHRVFCFCLTNIRKIINNRKENRHFVRKNAGLRIVTNSSEKSSIHQTTCSMPLVAVITLR